MLKKAWPRSVGRREKRRAKTLQARIQYHTILSSSLFHGPLQARTGLLHLYPNPDLGRASVPWDVLFEAWSKECVGEAWILVIKKSGGIVTGKKGWDKTVEYTKRAFNACRIRVTALQGQPRVETVQVAWLWA